GPGQEERSAAIRSAGRSGGGPRAASGRKIGGLCRRRQHLAPVRPRQRGRGPQHRGPARRPRGAGGFRRRADPPHPRGRGKPPPRWEVSTGSERGQLKGHEGWVEAVAVAPGGKVLATGASDGVVRLWDSGAGKVLAELAGHRAAVKALAFSPRSGLLA